MYATWCSICLWHCHKLWARMLHGGEGFGKGWVGVGRLARREAVWHAGEVSPQVVIVWSVHKVQSLQVVGDGLQPICATRAGQWVHVHDQGAEQTLVVEGQLHE